MKTPRPGPVIALDDLEHTKHAHEFVGAEHGEVPFSVILVHSEPGVGPRLHRSGRRTSRMASRIPAGESCA